MRGLIPILCLLVSISLPVWGNELEDAAHAATTGEYAKAVPVFRKYAEKGDATPRSQPASISSSEISRGDTVAAGADRARSACDRRGNWCNTIGVTMDSADAAALSIAVEAHLRSSEDGCKIRP